MRQTGRIAGLALIGLALLACNLLGTPAETPVPGSSTAPAGTAPLTSGDRPVVLIEAPVEGAQGVLRQTLTVRVRAADSVGITRVVMREVTGETRRIVVTQPSPDPVRDFEALLPYVPARTGVIQLEVLAYRGSVESEARTLTVEIVATAAELRNPGSIDPTSGAASGTAICTAQVNVNNLNLRSGPGTGNAILAKLSLGENLIVVGRNADMSWLKVRRTDGTEGWSSAQYMAPVGDCSKAPVIP